MYGARRPGNDPQNVSLTITNYVAVLLTLVTKVYILGSTVSSGNEQEMPLFVHVHFGTSPYIISLIVGRSHVVIELGLTITTEW